MKQEILTKANEIMNEIIVAEGDLKKVVIMREERGAGMEGTTVVLNFIKTLRHYDEKGISLDINDEDLFISIMHHIQNYLLDKIRILKTEFESI